MTSTQSSTYLKRVTTSISSKRTRYHHPLYLLSAILTLLSIQSSPSPNLVEALQCVSPVYDTVVQAGQSALLAWDTTSSDLSTYKTLTAVLYCMDIDGDNGGIWRTGATLFQNAVISSMGNQYKFSIPSCGSLVQNLAVRIVAQGPGNTYQESSCDFNMKQSVSNNPPTTTTTTALPPQTTSNAPSQSKTTTASTASVTSGSISTASVSGTITLSSTSATLTSLYPVPTSTNHLPLPPLPPFQTIYTPPSSTSGPVSGPSNAGGTHSSNHTLVAAFGSIGATAAIIAVISILVKRRRQSRRNGFSRSGGVVFGGLPSREKLRIKGFGSKGSNKNSLSDRSFFLMKEQSDDEDGNDDGDAEVAAKKRINSQAFQSLDSFEATGLSEKSSVLIDDITCDDQFRQSVLQRPSAAFMTPSPRRFSTPLPYSYSDDDYTMSSMRSSCETSSVIRQYWAASMAARAERRMNEADLNYPRSSISSQSRKADIFNGNASSFIDSDVDAARIGTANSSNGPFKKYYRSTVNSVNSYIRRSMSMSIASLRSGSVTDDDSWCRQHGFRSSINSEFLNHLNIKSLQNGQRQLEYYRYYYRQSPTISTVDGSLYNRPTSQQSVVTSGASHRTSSAPSLTSTNDPFLQNFDSNEIVLDLDPFSDNNAINFQDLPPPPPLILVGGGDVESERSNSSILRSFPSPPIIDSCSSISSFEL
ncbi:hypothetical protein BGZ46_002203 [Entomortierella lignicola]|nr:hypothetical protein BGZ46_002203 [Entomortierella lignicola]